SMASPCHAGAKNLDIGDFAAIVPAGFAAGRQSRAWRRFCSGHAFFGSRIMYAVIRTGGKQYRVAKNDVIKVERLPGEAGSPITFKEALMVGTAVGTPLGGGASVSATVLEQGKGEKIVVFKKRRRKNYRRKNGHRQYETVLRISDIQTA